jgi:polysaccharide pyruvyl transferase WcaK-like protein
LVTRRPRVLICSAAVVTPEGTTSNVGDEALTDVLARAVARHLRAEVVSTLADPRAGSALPAGRVPIRPIRALSAEIRRADLVIAGGGTLLQEDVRPRWHEPCAGLLRYIAAVAVLTRIHRKPFMLAAIGAENLPTRRSRLVARYICRTARAITTRDDSSAELIARVSGRHAVVADDAMFLNDAPLAAPNDERRDEIFVNLREGLSSEACVRLANALRPSLDAGHRVTLVPMDRRQDGKGDIQTLRRLEAALADTERVRVVDGELPWRELLARFGDAHLCIGMRLHFMIFAVLARRPLIALTTLPKTRAFVSDLAVCAVDFGELDQLPQELERARSVDSARLNDVVLRAERTLECAATLIG